MRIHIVQKGETLWRISKQYGIGLDELKRLNAHLANPDYIVPGMEIILPDATEHHQTMPKSTTQQPTMTKEQLTAPIHEVQPAPIPPKVVQTAPIPPKVVQTAPIPPKVVQTAPKVEHKKEITKVIETKPMPMPMPKVDLTPKFHFDFAPQMHLQPQPMPHMPQPQPIFIEVPQQPMPMPQPQPIFIEVPQQPVPQPEKPKVEKEIEYVPVPHHQIIYVPFIPHCPKPIPCCPKHPHHHHKPPCGCHKHPHRHHHQPCGCHMQMPEQMMYEMPEQMMYEMPEQMMYQMPEQMMHQMPEQMMYQMPEQMMHQMPEQMMHQMPQYNDCGCRGGYQSEDMMPYGLPNFDPNYDAAPSMGVAPAMDVEDMDNDGLPDWLLDSSEKKSFGKKHDKHYMTTEQFVEDDVMESAEFDEKDERVAGYYDEMYNIQHDGFPQTHYGQYYMPEQMQQMMPQQVMPQQMMYPCNQSHPYMNPYSQHYTPWKY